MNVIHFLAKILIKLHKNRLSVSNGLQISLKKNPAPNYRCRNDNMRF